VELRQLRYLDRVAATGGFRSAARDLGVSQPTLTAQIKDLERDMGVMLLDRSQRPIRLTPAGQVIVVRVRELLSMATRLTDDIADIAKQHQGRLRLGTNQWATPMLPLLMAGFGHIYPNIEVVLRECVSRDAPRLMLRGDLDVCILAVRAGIEPLPERLQATRLFSFEHVFVVPPGHRLEGCALVKLDDLAHERLVLTSGMSGTLLKEACAQAGITPHVAVETNDAEMVPTLVAQGMGIGFTPDFVIRRSQPQLKTFKVSDLSLVGEALLAWTAQAQDQTALRAFLRFVRAQHLNSEPAMMMPGTPDP
jgi:DNA-binding transcriptional LysR family regulator